MTFGPHPTLEISDADPPPNSGPKRPWVLRSRFLLQGRGQEACFHTDRKLAFVLRPGDCLHVAQTARGALALSVVRGQQLVFAVGAVTAVPLGDGMHARIAPELRDKLLAALETNWVPQPAVSLLEARHPGFVALLRLVHLYRQKPPRPSALYRDQWPVELEAAGETMSFFSARTEFRGFEVAATHAFCLGPCGTWERFLPKGLALRFLRGKDESVAISRKGLCSPFAANDSAQLLAADGLERS